MAYHAAKHSEDRNTGIIGHAAMKGLKYLRHKRTKGDRSTLICEFGRQHTGRIARGSVAFLRRLEGSTLGWLQLSTNMIFGASGTDAADKFLTNLRPEDHLIGHILTTLAQDGQKASSGIDVLPHNLPGAEDRPLRFTPVPRRLPNVPNGNA